MSNGSEESKESSGKEHDIPTEKPTTESEINLKRLNAHNF